MLGYLAIVWPYLIIVCALLALVSGFMGPGDQFFRFADLGVWFSISYRCPPCNLGLRYALRISWRPLEIRHHTRLTHCCLGAWYGTSLHVCSRIEFPAYVNCWMVDDIIDSGAYLVWPDMAMFTEAGSWAGGSNNDASFFFIGGNELPGYSALEWAQSDLGLGIGPYATTVVSMIVLLFQARVLLVYWTIDFQVQRNSVRESMDSFAGDFSTLWTLNNRPPIQHLTWDWWWWLGSCWMTMIIPWQVNN